MRPRLAASLAVAAALPFLTAGSCATTSEPRLQVHDVPMPLAVSCVPSGFPKGPIYPDTKAALAAAKDVDQFDQLMQAGWPLRDARLSALEAQVDACR